MAIMDTTPEGRAVIASQGALWAYWWSLSRSDWASASSALVVFQRHWPEVRPTVIGALPAEFRESLERTLPRSLSLDGAWTTETRAASLAVLLAVFGSDVYREVAPSLPREAWAVGAWYTNTMNERFDRLDPRIVVAIDSFVAEVQEGPQFAGANVEGRFAEYVSGVSVGTPTIGPRPTPEAVPPQPRSTPQPQPQQRNPIELMPVRVTGTRTSWSPWILAALGIGAVAFGVFAFAGRRVQLKRRRFA